MLSISFLNKLPFKGSYNGKRFMFEKIKEIDDTETGDKENLRVYLWKDLYSFEKTDKKDIETQDFEFSEEGIEKGIDFVESTNI